MGIFKDKVIVITGGTGSLGQVLTRKILGGDEGKPRKVIIFSRDEAKQHYMRLDYQNKVAATDEVIYNNFKQLLEFRIGDIRDYHSVVSVLKGADIVINAAALKQVPSCEYFPSEAIKTNILGPDNIVKAINEFDLKVDTVVGVSTDKACKPINVMGMTKALQERVFIGANVINPNTRFICVRYGNVLASRGSVIPLFHEQILNKGPVTVTSKEMTRFLMPLDKAVETIIAAIKSAKPGETYIPKAKSAYISDVAEALIGSRNIEIIYTGIRPGEKIKEILISTEELQRTTRRGEYYAIKSFLPELIDKSNKKSLPKEYSSSDQVMKKSEVASFLRKYGLLLEQIKEQERELIK